MIGKTGAGAPELGLFVIWPNARMGHQQILNYAQTLFDVRRVYHIHWTRGLISESYARFTQARLGPAVGAVPAQFGTDDPFLLVTAVDSSPRYEPRVMPRGPVHVNARFFDAGQEFGVWAGGESRVHASVSATQAARDLMLLLGTDPRTHLKENPRPWNGRIEEVHRDLSGAGGWSSPAELFHVLNHTVRYVVLRNFEGLPDSLHVGSHEDVDLLTDNYQELVRLMNARPHVRCVPPRGGPYWAKISGEDMWFDLRFVGDFYYDPEWARDILDRRVWNAGGFFTPNKEDYFESLAYHAVVHKNALSAEYKERLAEMARSLGRPGWEAPALEDAARVRALLGEILARRGCRYRRPRDVNVFYNFEAAGHRWPHARRKLAGVFRKALRIGYRLWCRLRTLTAPSLFRGFIHSERAVQ